MNWSFQSWSVSDFYLNASDIDVNPVGQRPSVSPNPIGGEEPSKQQGIINTILKGGDIGEIKLVETPDGEYKYESIDGGNRKRAILSFLRKEFPTHNSSVVGEKYVNQLTDEERETLMQYKIRFIIYPPMTTRQKGETFRDTNNTTPVNQQETLNSYGDIPIANLIRNTSRTVPGMGNSPHELFFSYVTKGDNEVYKNVAFNNNRLAIDEIVARITHMIYKGEKLTTASFDELQAMYDDQKLDDAAVKTLKKKLDEFLDFALKVSVSRLSVANRGIAKGHMVALYRLWFYLKQEYGSFKVTNFDKFWDEFFKAFSAFNSKAPTRTEVVEKNKDGTGGRLIFEAFNGYLGDHKTQRKIDQQVKWFLEEFDMDASTIVLQSKANTFDRHLVEVMLARQGYKDWIDDQPLTMKDAEGGHIIPYSLGGTTTIDNLVVISRTHNRRMQDTNAHDYKAAFLSGRI